MPVVTNPESIWPVVQDIYVLDMNTSYILFFNGPIEERGTDSYVQGCKANNARFALPKIATSRSALQCLGFTEAAVEEIWAYANNPMSATPMLTNSVPTEHWILEPSPKQQSSRELLDHLGLRDAVQIQYYQHNAPPIFGGSKKSCLVLYKLSKQTSWNGLRRLLRGSGMRLRRSSIAFSEEKIKSMSWDGEGINAEADWFGHGLCFGSFFFAPNGRT